MAFVIVKCTEGADFVDPSFKTFWKQLVGFDVAGDGPVHLLRGAYHFARPDNRGGRAGGGVLTWFGSEGVRRRVGDTWLSDGIK